MKKKTNKTDTTNTGLNTGKTKPPVAKDLTYPAGEDIYLNSHEEQDIDPEDPSKLKAPNEMDTEGKRNEKRFGQDVSGSDLDVPGAELDDEEESNGNEDEENNHYSIGGDGHKDLEEDNRA